MEKNTSLLTKFTHFLEKANAHQAFQRPKTFLGCVSNIIRIFISWFLSAIISFQIYAKLPQFLPDGCKKVILVCCYFGFIFFFSYFPFATYLKKLTDKLTFNKKMQNRIDEIGQNPESE